MALLNITLDIVQNEFKKEEPQWFQCEWNDLFYYFNKAGWTILPFRNVDFITLSSLTLHHGDPFDRLMACQAINQKMKLISKDIIFDSYGVTRIW
jgi:PIN domain nuclease of toxin-antitoxin system